MYFLAPIPQQFVDHSGIPYEGGTVEVYLHGTTDLAVIYADARGAAEKENPVTLDSNGVWIAFVSDSVSLDYIVKDRFGNVVFSFYDIVLPAGGSIGDVTKAYVDDQDDSLRDQINSVASDLNNKLDKNGNGADVYVTFNQAADRTPLQSDDTLAILFGKIKKWLSSLESLAFKDKADLISDISGILPIENGGTGAGTVVGARSNLDVYSKSEVESLLAGRIVFVTVLPTTGEAGKIYYLEVDTNVYDTYIWGYAPGATEESWILIGRQELDLDDYKKKQRPYSKTGSKTKTITALSQDANGEIDATFEDIEIPESVPNVEITSPNNTISVSSSEDQQTNTKTFSIDVKGSLEYYIGRTNAWKTLATGRNIVQDLTRVKGTLNLSALGVGKYLVCVNLRYKSAGAATNIVGELWVSLGPENTFTQMKKIDYSQNAVEDCMTVVAITEISLASEPLIISLSLNNAPQAGLNVLVSNVSVYRISSILGSMNSIESVEHDESLTGDGTSESPLSVVIDENLDQESKNPVENRAVNTALNGKQDQLTEMMDQEISDLIEALN